MRCATCGAWNPATASWCGQCLTRFADAGPASDARAADGVAPSADTGSRDARAGDVRTVAGEVEWRCATCGGWNALFAPSCSVCGAPRAGFGGPVSAPPRPVATGTVVATSVVWPGAGHLLGGRVGTGAARALLWVVWLLAGIGLWRAAGAGSGVVDRAPALSLLLGAAVLWGGTLVDARHLASGRAELLAARQLGILVAAVTAGLLLTVVLVAT